MGTEDLEAFTELYRHQLQDYLSRGSEDALHHAYELGRQAQSEGLGLLDLTSVHRNSLSSILATRGHGSETLLDCFKVADKFLDETFSPYEVSRLASLETAGAMRRLLELLEQEAKRIAYVLHDEAAQMLATVYLELAEIEREAPEDVVAKVHQVVKHLDEVREQLRSLSHELRPLVLDQLGLLPALQSLAEGVQKRKSLQITIKGDTDGRLPQAIETLLYRVAQEALFNVIKHAKARSAWIHVWLENGSVKCSIRDDGVGLLDEGQRSQSFRGLGLVSINERVNAMSGNCTITSEPGKGVELLVSIPL